MLTLAVLPLLRKVDVKNCLSVDCWVEAGKRSEVRKKDVGTSPIIVVSSKVYFFHGL